MRRERELPRLTGLGLLLAAVVAACSTAGGSNGATSPSPGSSGTGASPSAPAGFYLRAWTTQALAPDRTFGWLPMLTISTGTLIDGQIAVPAIYPGPLYISPVKRAITPAGIDAILAEAQRDGLIGSKTAFDPSPAPGAPIAHVEMVVDGKRYELTGDPAALTRCRCIPDPGTAGAFAAFFQRLGSLDQWIPNELGPEQPYAPDRLAVLAIDPVKAEAPIRATEVAWPLGPFSAFGRPFAGGGRCATVSGADLAKLLPAVRDANQLTRFVDAAGVAKSLQVRALVPGEPAPCQP